MSKKVNLTELASIISGQTGINQSKVEEFIKIAFQSIESALLASSTVRIDNLGTFKIFKGGLNTPKKILFLPDNNPQAYIFKLPLGESEKISVVDASVADALNDDSGNNESPEIESKSESETEKTEVTSEKEKAETVYDPNLEKRKARLKRVSVLTVVVALLLAVYFLFFSGSDNAADKVSNSYFEEVVNNDTVNFLGVVQTLSDGNLLRISHQYYGHEGYWVYIYEKNRDIVNDPPYVAKDATIKIPKMDQSLIDPQNEQSLQLAEEMALKIISPKSDQNSQK
ncbi:HU family DNA-binding protein [Dysgonomonas sp. 520]|uniref:HU family DNA-binding protein n=1 Tax=Dysgonomonas sp. 520 TaxID=2302931 RepID=UPI0013D538B1|nr:HU family DNA-binding protein [Dysgonomonas sp. 520]NDW09584.1 hypothetical protein [Dysgonomonas sp. 520]